MDKKSKPVLRKNPKRLVLRSKKKAKSDGKKSLDFCQIRKASDENILEKTIIFRGITFVTGKSLDIRLSLDYLGIRSREKVLYIDGKTKIFGGALGEVIPNRAWETNYNKSLNLLHFFCPNKSPHDSRRIPKPQNPLSTSFQNN